MDQMDQKILDRVRALYGTKDPGLQTKLIQELSIYGQRSVNIAHRCYEDALDDCITGSKLPRYNEIEPMMWGLYSRVLEVVQSMENSHEVA